VVSLVRRTKLERREATYVVLSRPTTDLGPPAWTLVGIRLSRAFRRPTLLHIPSGCLPFRLRQQTLQVFDNSQTRWWQSDAASPVDFGPNRTRNAGISPIPRELPEFRFVPAAAAFVGLRPGTRLRRRCWLWGTRNLERRHREETQVHCFGRPDTRCRGCDGNDFIRVW